MVSKPKNPGENVSISFTVQNDMPVQWTFNTAAYLIDSATITGLTKIVATATSSSPSATIGAGARGVFAFNVPMPNTFGQDFYGYVQVLDPSTGQVIAHQASGDSVKFSTDLLKATIVSITVS